MENKCFYIRKQKVHESVDNSRRQSKINPKAVENCSIKHQKSGKVLYADYDKKAEKYMIYIISWILYIFLQILVIPLNLIFQHFLFQLVRNKNE